MTHEKTRDDYEDGRKPTLDLQTGSQERVERWFNGTIIMPQSDASTDLLRQSNLHNRITQRETDFNSRNQENARIANQLSEFFPQKWLDTITKRFKSLSSKDYIFKTYNDRVCMYLAYIDILLLFRNLTLKNSTLEDLSECFQVNLSREIILNYHKKIFGLFSDLRKQWKKTRENATESIFFNMVIDVLNNQVTYPDSCSSDELLTFKHTAANNCKRFCNNKKVKNIKAREKWAKAVCLYTAQELFVDRGVNIFPLVPIKELVLIRHKAWQIRKEFSSQ